MAFKIVDSYTSKLPHVTVPLDGSTATTKGSLMYADTSAGTAKTNTSAAGDAVNTLGICDKTLASGATSVEITPVGDKMLIEADCTNSTAANQLLKFHVLTDGATVNNTSTTSTDIKAVFFAVALKGAAADKKLLGYVMRVGHVTA